jgi:hypothetical protein
MIWLNQGSQTQSQSEDRQDVYFESVWDIRLECHQNYRPILISRIVFFLDVRGSEFHRGVFGIGSQQSVDSGLHQSFMAIVTQVVRCELVF